MDPASVAASPEVFGLSVVMLTLAAGVVEPDTAA